MPSTAEKRAAAIRAVQGLTSIATLSGIVLYGLLRTLYEAFYAPFGVAPEEAGIDFLTVVSRGGLIVAMVVCGALIPVLIGRWAGSYFFNTVPLRFRRPILPRLDFDVRALLTLLLLILAVVLGSNYVLAEMSRLDRLARQAQRGLAVRPTGLLQIRAQPVTVEWLASREAPSVPEHVMLLGQRDGTSLVFDVANKAIVRLPTNAFAAIPRCHDAYPDICISPRTPDLDCRQLPASNFEVREPDPYEFDLDGDQIGCEGIHPGQPQLPISEFMFVAMAAATILRFNRLARNRADITLNG